MAIIETRKQHDGTLSYRARVRLKGHPEHSQTFTRKTDARDWAQQIEATLRRGRQLPTAEASRRTVAEMIDRFTTQSLPRRARNKDAVKTSALLTWWRERIGDVAIVHVTPALIAECRDELLAGKTTRGGLRTPATVNRYLAAISACFREAIREWHWLEQSPMPAVSRGAEHPGVVRFLSEDERDRLLRATASHGAPWLRPLVMLALATGARRGELLGLRWADVDLERGMVTFHITKNRERRSVPVAGSALTVLRTWADARRADDDRVFPGPLPTLPLNIENAWRDALATADVRDFRFHDLRHSAASYLAMSGATAPEIAAVLGHKTLAMVKRYAHLGEQHTAAVVERMVNKFLPAND
ncbi:MAG TPA: site-specific integrase [Burkholderiales bacterium]|nr:site-specific integrase [Burkholderiales bacterium]